MRLINYLCGVVVILAMNACLDTDSFCSTELIVGEGETRLHIGMDANEHLLDSIQKVLKSNYNINLDFTGTEFDGNGNLNFLNLSVDCNDGFHGKTKSNREGLYTTCVGFVRSSTSDFPFRIGAID